MPTPEIDIAGHSRPTPEALGAGRAFVYFLIFFLAQLLLGGLVGVVLGIWLVLTGQGQDPETVAVGLQPFLMPITVLAAAASGLLVFGLVRRHLPGPIDAGALSPLGWKPCTARAAAYGAIAGVGLGLFYLFALTPLSSPVAFEDLGPVGQAVAGGGWTLHWWALFAVLIAPPIEEFVFRGVLYAGFVRSWRPAMAGIAVTILFVLSHATEMPNGAAVLAVTLAGGATMAARIVTGSLAAALVVHVAYNLVIVVAQYAGAG